MFWKSESNKERRRRERRAFSSYMQFLDERTGELMGDLADISHEGFRLEGSKHVPPNAELEFRVDLPPDFLGKACIVVKARSRWTRPHPIDARLYVSGYEIMHMDPGDARAYKLIFDRFGSTGPAKRATSDYLWKD
jgi:hypothetical protein